MRRLTGLLAIVAAVLLGLLTAGRASPGTVAQEGTPGAMGTPEAEAARVTFELLGAAPPAPGQALTLIRLTFAPGASLPPHINPGTTIAFVESGTLALGAVAGVAEIRRVLVPGDPAYVPPATPGAGTPPAATPVLQTEAVVIGAESVLNAGESVAFGPDLIHAFANAGEDEAVLLLSGLYAAGEEPFQFLEAAPEGTPVAATPAP